MIELCNFCANKKITLNHVNIMKLEGFLPHSEGRKRTDVKTPPCSGVFLLTEGKD
jgi:hypothetical protein